MKKLLVLLTLLCVYSLNNTAQLKYHSNGKLTLGNVDPVGDYTSHLYGWGHYFSYKGSGYDTFLKVCLSVANPRISGTGNKIVFYNSETRQYNGIEVSNVLNASDARYKTNITPLRNATEKILSLNPVSYNWKESGAKTRTNSAGEELNEIGFLAQEVEEVLPELVHENTDGYKSINYIALIPVLTESLKELTDQLDKLNKEVDELRAEKLGNNGGVINNTDKAILYQNSPNPFNGETVIKYYLPESTRAQNAGIYVFNLQGVLVLKKDITTTGIGEGQTTIEASGLNSGIYLYSLVINNKEVDTKRMLITK